MQNIDNISLNFILSTARTGSTLLSSMLNMHPNVISTVEEPFAYNLYPKYKNTVHWDEKTIDEFCYDFYLFNEGYLEAQFGKKEDLVKLLKEHSSNLTVEKAIKLVYFAFHPNKDKSQVNTIVDKELKFHYYLNEVANFYPNSKFIILCRDPRDNVLIKLKRAKKRNKRQSVFFFSKTWNYEYSTLNRKISKISSDRYIKIKYEDLVEDPEKVLKKISEFLNIPYSNIMLNYDEKFKNDLNKNNLNIGETVKQHLSLFHEGLTQKVNTDKVNIWQTQLSNLDNNMIWSVCKNTALTNGYKEYNCKKISYFRINMLYDLCRFYFFTILIPNLYYLFPFKIRYIIKKIKYGKNFINGSWVTKDFYKASLPENK